MEISKTKLSLAMASKGFNFATLSKESSVSRATLSYINNGKTCRPDILFRIAKALDVTPSELIREEA